MINIDKKVPQLLRVYMAAEPRVLGLFHLAALINKEKVGLIGTIMHVGPCKCGDPAHKFPQYYSMTPCAFVRGFGKILTVRIPWMVFDAIQWIAGPPTIQP